MEVLIEATSARSAGRDRCRVWMPITAAIFLALNLVSPTFSQTAADENLVTAVEGASLLTRMQKPMSRSSLGRNGLLSSRLPSVGTTSQGAVVAGEWLTRGFDLSGEDLYRINCQACHRAGGEGLPPEVSAILDPVKASSAEQIEAQMAKRGRSISPTLAERLAERAELAIRHRLSEGGEVMAPFAHLNPEEVDELLAYLEYIAGVRKSPPSTPVPQRAARVGEHVVKAVCHICHDAQPAYRSREDHEVPPLQDLTARYSVKQIVKKVRTGKVGDERTRGRMPTFPFLSEEEITAAYIYLAGFPPVATSVFN